MTELIKDYEYVLGVGEKGEIELETEKLNGLLTTLIIDSYSSESEEPKTQYKRLYPDSYEYKDFTNAFDLRIYFSDLPNVAIYSDKRLPYRKLFIPIKVDYLNVNNEKYEAPDFWVINDKLKIYICGKKNLIVKIKLRFKVS